MHKVQQKKTTRTKAEPPKLAAVPPPHDDDDPKVTVSRRALADLMAFITYDGDRADATAAASTMLAHTADDLRVLVAALDSEGVQLNANEISDTLFRIEQRARGAAAAAVAFGDAAGKDGAS